MNLLAMNEDTMVNNVFTVEEVDVYPELTQSQQERIMSIVNKRENNLPPS